MYFSPDINTAIKFRNMSCVGHVMCAEGLDGWMYPQFWWGNLREGDDLDDPGADGKIILERIFRRWNEGRELDGSGSGQEQVAGCCEHCHEPGDVKDEGGFLD